MRSERFSTVSELQQHFGSINQKKSGAGPLIYSDEKVNLYDTSENHIAVIGNTGKGKSQNCSLNFIRSIMENGESAIILDPKKECYNNTVAAAPSNYNIFCIDFRSPQHSKTKWNPLAAPYKLYKDKDITKKDMASSMLSELWSAVYPEGKDPFWSEASINLARGCSYALYEIGKEKEINLNSVASMIEEAESNLGLKSLMKHLYEILPKGSLARRNIATYVTAPGETRSSIHSVTMSGLEVFSRSIGLMNLLSQDTLDLLNLDLNVPFLIYIVLPDETDVYDSLAGLLVSQLTQHLIYEAQISGGKLPIKTNIILEELGSVGRSIPNLANIMAAGRSRNLRVMLILQSINQLVDIYGKAKAEAIHSCIGLTVGFATNCWDTLKNWSERCGYKQYLLNGAKVKEPLITPEHLAAMPSGRALVLANGQYKFIANLPFYYERYQNLEESKETITNSTSQIESKYFDFEKCIKKLRPISNDKGGSEGFKMPIVDLRAKKAEEEAYKAWQNQKNARKKAEKEREKEREKRTKEDIFESWKKFDGEIQEKELLELLDFQEWD